MNDLSDDIRAVDLVGFGDYVAVVTRSFLHVTHLNKNKKKRQKTSFNNYANEMTFTSCVSLETCLIVKFQVFSVTFGRRYIKRLIHIDTYQK